jgi:hypothetical protein
MFLSEHHLSYAMGFEGGKLLGPNPVPRHRLVDRQAKPNRAKLAITTEIPMPKTRNEASLNPIKIRTK